MQSGERFGASINFDGSSKEAWRLNWNSQKKKTHACLVGKCCYRDLCHSLIFFVYTYIYNILIIYTYIQSLHLQRATLLATRCCKYMRLYDTLASPGKPLHNSYVFHQTFLFQYIPMQTSKSECKRKWGLGPTKKISRCLIRSYCKGTRCLCKQAW